MKNYEAMTHDQLAQEADDIRSLMEGVTRRENWVRLAELQADMEALNSAARAKNAIKQHRVEFSVNL